MYVAYSRGSVILWCQCLSYEIRTFGFVDDVMFVHKYGKRSFIKYATLEGEGAQEFVAVCDSLRGRTGHCVARAVKVIHLSFSI